MPIKISIRKSDIYSRKENFRGQGISSMQMAHDILKQADPNYETIIKNNERKYKKSLDSSLTKS